MSARATRRAQETHTTARGSLRTCWQPALLALLLVGCAPAAALSPTTDDGPIEEEMAWSEVETEPMAAMDEPVAEFPEDEAPLPPAPPAPAEQPPAPAPKAPAPRVVVVHEPAPAPPAPAAPRPARLSVRNGTGDHVTLRVDGAIVATLAPRRSFTMPALEPGRHALTATSETAGVRHTATVQARRGSSHRWDIEQRYGRLRIRNRRRGSVLVHIDGKAAGTVAGRATHTFVQVPEGNRSVSIHGARGRLVRHQPLYFRRGHEVRWTLDAPTRPGALEVVNSTRRRLVVALGGRRLGRVAPGTRARFTGIEPGVHTVSGKAHKRPRREERLGVRPGRTTTWIVEPMTAALRVVNRGHRPVIVSADGRRLGRVRPGAARRFDGLRPGRTLLTAATPRGRLVDERTVRLRPGAGRRWTVDFGLSVAERRAERLRRREERLRAERRRERERRAQARRQEQRRQREHEERMRAERRRERERRKRKAQTERERRERRAQARRERKAQARRERKAQARRERKERERKEQEARRAQRCTLVVLNRSSEPIVVKLDGRRLGKLAAKGRKAFTGQPRGKHGVTARGTKTGGRDSETVVLAAKGATVSFELHEPRGAMAPSKKPVRKPTLHVRKPTRLSATRAGTKPGLARIERPAKPSRRRP